MSDNDRQSVHVEFLCRAEHDENESLRQNRPVFIEHEMVRIRWPGDSKRELVAMASERSDRYEIMPDMSKVWLTWAQAFPKHYEAFKRGDQQVGDGTPLKALDVITAARRAELNALNIYTVEALASLEGIALQKLGMNARKLKDAAAQFLQRQAGADIEARLREELDSVRARLDEMLADKNQQHAEAPASEDSSDDAQRYFEELDADALRTWLKDNGKEPHHRQGRESLIKMAVDANAEMRRKAADAMAA